VSRGLVQPFYRHTGKGRRLSAPKLREVQLGQGRGVAGASLLGHRESMAAWRGVGHWWIRGRGGRFGRGPVGARPFGVTRRQESPARWPAATASRRDRIGEGEREKESEGRERKSEGLGSKKFFSKVCMETLKSASMKVVGNLKLYDFCFGSTFEL
jgi:hypothetical protein